jgi:hypothetical protein
MEILGRNQIEVDMIDRENKIPKRRLWLDPLINDLSCKCQWRAI